MRRFNVFAPEFMYDDSRPEGYRVGSARLGPVIGSSRVSATVYEVPAGESSWPYHYEYGAEEWALVLAGRPTLRHPGGEDELEPGDVVCFPDGPEGAHKFTNRGEETARVMILSTYDRPAVAVYPDSDKLGVWSDGEDDVLIVRRESAVDYWHGER
jgi:uncharacterized cupin superfamily protein